MSTNDRDDLLEFLTSHEEPPHQLTAYVRRDINLELQKKTIIAKFLGLQTLGAAISLVLCPQFGIGLIEGHGIVHFFQMLGDAACAAFCGSLFLLAGSLTSSLGMKSEEIFWIWKRYRLRLIFAPAFLWSLLMLFNAWLNLNPESIRYNIVWLLSAVIAQQLVLYLRSRSYSGILRLA